MKKIFLATLFLFSSFAQAFVWTVNKDHSEIFFQVPYLTVSEVTGRFTKFTGELRFPESAKNPDYVFLSIDVGSLDTGNKTRDGHLKSQDFLKAKTRPEIKFESTAITQVKPDLFRANGNLTVAGVSKSFVVEFSLTDAMKDTWNYENRFVKFRSKINRKDFGITWNKTLSDSQYLVGEEISFWGNMQLQPQQGATPSNKHMIPDTAQIREREKLNRGEVISEKSGAKVNIVPPTTSEKKWDVKKRESEITKNVDETRDSVGWWVAFGFLGMLGFMATIAVGLYIKDFVSKRYPIQYSEGGLMGLSTDILSIIFGFAYAVALWEVGWG